MSNEIRRTARIIPAVRNNGGQRVVSFLPVRAGFDAASRSPESMRHFAGANFLSADAALSPDVRKTIISRVRNEVVNNGYAWGILDTLAGNGIRPEYVTAQAGYGYQFGKRAACEILEHAPDVTCIMNSNDMAAFGCIDELLSRGFSIPDDLSVTGADGLKLPGRGIRIDSFFSPAFEIGKRGAEELFNQISGNTVPQSICLPVTPVEGETIRDLNLLQRNEK